MRNLKKVLSLAMALVMVFALVVPASAADASNATDWKDVKNQSAVSLLSSLEIMNGFPDGTYRPGDTLTRAQVAKMIYVARTGGVDDGAVMFASENRFSDISGHWGAGYINYAFISGIVSGRGDGKYDPEGTITGYEVMKIALTALGYNSKIEGFEGTFWKSNVAAMAKESGLTVGYTGNPANAITRDEAALIISNMIYLYTVTYSTENIRVITTNNKTFGEKYLNLEELKGILVSNGDIYLGGTPKAGVTVLNNVAYVDNGVTKYAPRSFNYTVDAKYLGYAMTALVRLNTRGDVTNVYGITPTVGMNSEIASGKIGTETANASTGAAYYVNYVEQVGVWDDVQDKWTTAPWTQFGVTMFGYKEDEAKFIDNNADGKYEYALKIDYKFVTISTVSTSSVAISGTTVDKTDIIGTVPVRNDVIAYYTYPGVGGNTKYVVTVLEPIKATVTTARNTGTTSDYADINGVRYTNSNDATYTIQNDVSLNVEATYYVFKTFLAKSTASATPANYAYVVDVNGDGSVFTPYKAWVVLSGTDAKNGDYTLSTAAGTATKAAVDAGGGLAHAVTGIKGNIYTYSINSYGQLVLNPATQGTLDVDTHSYTKGGNMLDSKIVDSTTVLFYQTSTGNTWAVYTGIGNIPGYDFIDDIKYIAKTITGASTTGVGAAVVLNNQATAKSATDQKYYVVLAAPETTVVDGVSYWQFIASDGSDTVNSSFRMRRNDNTAPVVAGGVYTFGFGSNNIVQDVSRQSVDKTNITKCLFGFVTYNRDGSLELSYQYTSGGTQSGSAIFGIGTAKVYAVTLGANPSVVLSDAEGLALRTDYTLATDDYSLNATAKRVNYDTLVVKNSVGTVVAVYYFNSTQSFDID